MANKKDEYHSLKYLLRRHYSGYASTFAKCPTDGCDGSGRGGGLCAKCLQVELDGLVGNYLSGKFHNLIISIAETEREMDKIMEANNDR